MKPKGHHLLCSRGGPPEECPLCKKLWKEHPYPTPEEIVASDKELEKGPAYSWKDVQSILKDEEVIWTLALQRTLGIETVAAVLCAYSDLSDKRAQILQTIKKKTQED